MIVRDSRNGKCKNSGEFPFITFPGIGMKNPKTRIIPKISRESDYLKAAKWEQKFVKMDKN